MLNVKSSQPFKSTVVVGAPNCTANLGSLAIDILSNSQNAVKVGQIQSPLLEPFVGKIDGELYTNCEIYNSDNYSFVIFRSPALKGLGFQFSTELSEWLNANFEKVIILAGLDQKRRNDDQIGR